MLKILKRDAINGDHVLACKTFDFPAGELGVKLDTDNLRYLYARGEGHQTITARIHDSRDFMELVMVTDALRRFDPMPVHLVLPYLPYARQDRVCVSGESFSLQAFARLINSLGFERVTVFDPHSDVTGAVLDRVRVYTQFDIVNKFQPLLARLSVAPPKTPFLFVSPDAGSNKKTAELAKLFGHSEFVRADKLRELETGKILETVVYREKLDGFDAVICDDLCDGGRTFTELAKVLKAKGAAKVVLYVTHGIFTKGVQPLFDQGIDEIFTTNSYHDNLSPNGPITVLKLEEAFRL